MSDTTKTATNGQTIMQLGHSAEAAALDAENRAFMRKERAKARAAKTPEWYRGRVVRLPDGSPGTFLQVSQHKEKGEFAHCLSDAGLKVVCGMDGLRRANQEETE